MAIGLASSSLLVGSAVKLLELRWLDQRSSLPRPKNQISEINSVHHNCKTENRINRKLGFGLMVIFPTPVYLPRSDIFLYIVLVIPIGHRVLSKSRHCHWGYSNVSSVSALLLPWAALSRLVIATSWSGLGDAGHCCCGSI